MYFKTSQQDDSRILSRIENFVPYHAGFDAVFFDSCMPHCSLPNTTDQARRVLYITFNKASEGDSRKQYYADKRKNYPPDIDTDPDGDYAFKV